MVRGIAVVRRDNFTSAVEAQRALLNIIMRCPPTEELLEEALKIRRTVRRSLSHLHDALPPPGCDPLPAFIQTGSLSKPMVGPGAYSVKDVVTPALAVARANPARQYGLGSRVPWLLRAGTGTVASRAVHPDQLEGVQLDTAHYMGRVDAVIATLLAPIMAARMGRNASMAGAAVEIRIEARKGDRDAVAGMAAARSMLAADTGGSATMDPTVEAPPAEPAHKTTFQRGVQAVTVVGGADGRAWATGGASALAPLPWPAARWPSDGRFVTGRARLDVSGGWDERLAEANAAFVGWVVSSGARKRPMEAAPAAEAAPKKKVEPEAEVKAVNKKAAAGGKKAAGKAVEREATRGQRSIASRFNKG